MKHPCATFDLIPPALSAADQARALFILLNKLTPEASAIPHPTTMPDSDRTARAA